LVEGCWVEFPFLWNLPPPENGWPIKKNDTYWQILWIDWCPNDLSHTQSPLPQLGFSHG
jgi:hypothetical protein